MTIAAAIYSRLANYSGVTAITSAIHIDHLPQTPSIPAIVFNVESTERQSAMSADTGVVRADISVVCYSTNADDAETLAAQTRAALQRYSGTVASMVILDCFIIDESIEYNDSGDRNHSVDQSYEVWFRE